MRAVVQKLRWLLYHAHYSGRVPVLLSELRKRWVVFRHPNATIEFGPHVYLGPGFRLDIGGSGTFVAGRAVELRRGFTAEISGDGRIAIGAGSIFTCDPLLQCTTSIEFGERCIVGQNAMFADGNHRFRDPDVPLNDQGYDYEPLRVGDDVTIFSKVTITSSIGDHAVVAANAVVTKPVEPYTLVGGVPAKLIERLKG